MDARSSDGKIVCRSILGCVSICGMSSVVLKCGCLLSGCADNRLLKKYSMICEIAESPLSVKGLIGGCAPLSIGVSSMKNSFDIPLGAFGSFIRGDCLKPLAFKVDVVSLTRCTARIRLPRLETACERT